MATRNGPGIPARLDPRRTSSGQFAPGNRCAADRTTDAFIELCRCTIDRFQLVAECAKMARGQKPYERATPEVRLKACELLFDRGYGRPRSNLEVTSPGGVPVKRIIWTDAEGNEVPDPI